MKKRILSLLLVFIMLLGALPVGALADEPSEPQTATATVNFTAQAAGAFLCAPQQNVAVSSDLAESYGYADSVTDGVSALDVLVKAHEVVFGDSFTTNTKDEYLLVVPSTGFVSKLFRIETEANGFVLNGGYPNDGTQSSYGGYNGTTVTTQAVTSGDTVEFFCYQDTSNWSDELAWFCQNGAVTSTITAKPSADVKLTMQSIMYMMGYLYLDADALHTGGSALSGAQLAWVNTETGAATDITGAVTDEYGKVTLTMPAEEGTFYLTAYMPATAIEDGEAPLVMSLTKVVSDENAPEIDPCVLTTLSVADVNSNPNALTLKPAFSSDVMSYSVDTVGFQQDAKMAYVKATAASETAVIKATLNGTGKIITSGDSSWMFFNNMLPGQDNVLSVTVADGDLSKTYTVTIPMASDPKIPHLKGESAAAETVLLGSTYTVDLSTIFEDADTAELDYTVKIGDGDPVSADKSYSYQPMEAGTYTLVFVASDSTNNSPAYTVTLNVVLASDHVMHNIAAKYAASGIAGDANYPWLAADLAAYAQIFPDTANKLNDEQRQDTLDKLIALAQTTTKPSDLAKTIIALRAMGYDAQKCVTSTGAELDAVKKLTDLVDAKASSVSNYYTLPYVLIALQQGSGYASEEQLGWLIEEALKSKTSWQNTTWGPDAATPMVLALAPYCGANEQVRTAVDEAFAAIAGTQIESGALASSAASTGLGMAAYAAFGKIGPVQNGKSLTDGLLTYATESKDGFTPTYNSFSTEQGFRGLIAAAKNGRVYDFASQPANAARATLASGCPVVFQEIPEGAEIVVKKEDAVQAANSAGRYYLDVGEYTYTASKSGYLTASGSFTVSEDEAQSHAVKTLPISLSLKPSEEAKDISVRVKVLTHDEKDCGGKYTYKHNSSSYTVVLAQATVTLKAGQTVFEALEKTLKQSGVAYTEKSFGYIDSIGNISEYDHGNQNSGWLYMVNGTVPQVGCRDWQLSSGDEVIWFFTDDYTTEKGSESWGGDSGSSSAATPDASAEVSTTVKPAVTADSKGNATAKVDEKTVAAALKQAEKDGATAIVIAPVVKGDAGKVAVELPTSAVKDIVSGTDAALNVRTDVGALNIPNDTLAEIIKAAGDASIAMSMEKANAAAVKEKLPETVKVEDAVAVEFKITSGSKTISSFGGKALEVFVPVSSKDHANGRSYVAFIISDDGTVEQTIATIKDGVAILTMRHFSTVVVTGEETTVFTDVVIGEYYYDAVLWAVANGITDGTSATTFSPAADCTRAQMVTFLWRAAGSPEPFGKASLFADVKEDAYYFKALLWAIENGITNGTSATTFSPDMTCTRGQMAAFLYRNAKNPAVSETSSFTDVKAGEYYSDAVVWAAQEGITNGTTATAFSPDMSCTRSQMVTFLYRYLEK